MKNFLLTLTLIASTFIYAQDMTDMNKWSVGLNFGGHDLHSPINTRVIKLYQPNFIQLNGRYMANNRFGAQLSSSFHYFNIEGTPNVLYTNLSLSGVANVGDLLRFSTWTKSFGLLAHGGIGWSSMWQKGYYQDLGIDPENPLHNSVDDMFSFSAGITPQYKLNDKFSLNLDLTFVQHALQSRSFDWETKLDDRTFNGSFMKLSIGVSYYIGSKTRHADWVPTEYGPTGELTNEMYDSRILNLEKKMMDDDGDGVPNYLDEEENTPKGSLVDSKGRALKDSDGDGVPDAYDKCPDVPGLWSMDGCPDTDGDGVPDHMDLCPEERGLLINKGCPEIDKESQEIMNYSIKNIQFEKDSDKLTESSFPVLDQVRQLMILHPEYSVLVEGHTCTDGSEEHNTELSIDRANKVKMYLVAKGIDEHRLVTKGHGFSRPAASNDTEEGKALNRRTEFKIIFK